MQLTQLEAFLAAAERGSFRRAAEALFLSQPSLSARVHALETELGVPLFHRMGRGVRLTEMGRAFRPYTERAIDALRQGREVIETTRGVTGGVLQIASARAIGTYTLPTILDRFRRQYPGIKVHISIGRSSDVLRMVAHEEVHVGLCRVLTDPDVVTTHLYDEDICLVTAPGHPFAVSGEASIYDVAREPLILYDRDSSYFVLIGQVCREAGITPRVEMTLDSIEATKHMVELGIWDFVPAQEQRAPRAGAGQCLRCAAQRGPFSLAAHRGYGAPRTALQRQRDGLPEGAPGHVRGPRSLCWRKQRSKRSPKCPCRAWNPPPKGRIMEASGRSAVGSAPRSGRGGRWFKSSRPDHPS